MTRMFISVLVALSLMLGTLPAIAASTSARAVATSQSTQAPTSRARATGKEDVKRYAQRERQANDDVARFRGGDVIIIGAGTAVLILVIVLLVVLL
jgi:hypothetical protein